MTLLTVEPRKKFPSLLFLSGLQNTRHISGKYSGVWTVELHWRAPQIFSRILANDLHLSKYRKHCLHPPSSHYQAESLPASHSPPQKSLVTLFFSYCNKCQLLLPCVTLPKFPILTICGGQTLRWRWDAGTTGPAFGMDVCSRFGQRQMLGCDTVTTKASDSPMGSLELGKPCRTPVSLRQEAQPLYLCINQSLAMGCPWKENGAWPKWLSSAELY